MEEMREETKEVEGESGGLRVFLSDKGEKVLRKAISKKFYIEERGFKELVPPSKEEVERRGWDMICQHLEPSRRAIVKEFYANLGEMKNLTCNVRGRWVPFGEKALSQMFKLKEGVDCSKFEKLQENPYFKEIAKELTVG